MKGHPKHPQGKSILGRRIFFYFVPAGVIFAALTVGAAILAGLGNRWMWWDFRTGLVILSSAAHCGLIAAAISLVGWILSQQRDSRRGIVFAIIGFLLGLAAFGIPWSWYRIAQRVPAIHDIMTDTENPPSFVAILKVRKGAPNPAEYGGPEVAAQQRAAYPGLAPLKLSIPPDKAFERALGAAQKMGWEIVDANPKDGRIEATATTFWFGFKDDIVIRVTPADQGSRVDVRSVSRMGRSDLGTNARRIGAYLKKLTQIAKVQ